MAQMSSSYSLHTTPLANTNNMENLQRGVGQSSLYWVLHQACDRTRVGLRYTDPLTAFRLQATILAR